MARLAVAVVLPAAGRSASIYEIVHVRGLTISVSIHTRILLLLLHLAGGERAAEDQP
jgi:hypothetical protein